MILFDFTFCLSKKQIKYYNIKRISNEIVKRTMFGILYLCDVLQFVIDCFNQSSFLQHS